MHHSAWSTINFYWTNLIFALILTFRCHEASMSYAYWVLFPVVLTFCTDGVCDGIWSGVGCCLAAVFLRPLWSLKERLKNLWMKILVLFFSPKSLDLNSYMHLVVGECYDFLIACYVLTTGPKANQKPSFKWCSDLRVTANQIMFHTFREKSRGRHTRLATENLRRLFPALFSERRGRLYTS